MLFGCFLSDTFFLLIKHFYLVSLRTLHVVWVIHVSFLTEIIDTEIIMNIHSETARSHEEARRSVCCVCSRKPKEYKTTKPITDISPKQADLVRQLVFEDFDVKNILHPTALCLSCNTLLSAIARVYIYIFIHFQHL